MCSACPILMLEDYKLALLKCLVNPNCSAILIILFELAVFVSFFSPMNQCFHVADVREFHKKRSYACAHAHIFPIAMEHDPNIILSYKITQTLFYLQKGQKQQRVKKVRAGELFASSFQVTLPQSQSKILNP